MATDWTKLRAEYVTSGITMRDLAEHHRINAAGVMRRAAKEGWDAERKQESARVSKAAIEATVPDRIAELEKFNADDLKMARAIRDKAAQMMNSTSTPHDLRALAGVIDTAQKVGRLALGVSTNNSELTGRDGTDLIPRSGVLMVPAAIGADEWEAAVAQQQAKLVARN